MPLPWKKEKPRKSMNRSLSRFINEIRASKRGESLVVETGFPTSLIDLIVKNRNRFNSTTKKHWDSQTPESCENTPRQPNTHLAPLILNSINTLLSESESNDNSVLRETADKNFSEDDCVVDKLELREIEIQDQDSEVEVSVRKDRTFMVAIKLFGVLILAVSTKKFAISITLSAFILLFFEILFKSFVDEYRRLTVSVHFGGGERRLSLIDVDDDIVVANFVDYGEELEGGREESKVTEIELGDSEVKDVSVAADEEIGKRRRTVRDKIRAKFKKLGGEFKNGKSKKDCKLEESNVESTSECVIEDGGEHEEDIDNGSVGNVVESKQKKRKDGEETDVGYGSVERPRAVSTKDRAKQFVKKLGDDIKHRRNKKERKLGQNTVESTTQEDKIHEGEEQEKDKEVADDHNDEDAEVEEANGYDLINISKASSDLGCPKRIGKRRKWSWSSSILVVILLAGLVGGRIMALILSILSLLLHKLVGAN